MYWMLLPLNANLDRHLDDSNVPPTGYWIGVFRAGWQGVVQFWYRSGVLK